MAKSMTRKRLRREHRALRSETLEPRMLLAANFLGDVNPLHNYIEPADVNRDGHLSPRDALVTIGYLNQYSHGESQSSDALSSEFAPDMNNDGLLSPADALNVIREVNSAERESDAVIQFMYTLTDEFGNPITNNRVRVEDDFRLNLFAQDLRRGSQREGVFSGFADVIYNSESAFSLVYGEKQKITIENCLCDGTFTLTLNDETTEPINAGQSFDSVATSIQIGLEGLPSVEPGDVEVSRPFGNAPEWFVRFTGQYQKQSMPEMTIDVSNLSADDESEPVTGTVEEIEPADASNRNTFNSAFPTGPGFLSSKIASQGASSYQDVGAFYSGFSADNPNEPVLLNYFLLHAESRGEVRFTAGRPDNPQADVLLFGIPEDLLDEAEHLIDYSPADITVILERPVNAIDDSYPASGETLLEDSSATLLDVLANDFLEDGSDGELALDPNGLGTPDQGGVVSISGDEVLYTPAVDFFGIERFTYIAVDGLGNSNSATVTVDVTNVNDPPIAFDDSQTVLEDSADNSIDPLANDIVGPANEGETLTIVSVTAGSHAEDFADRVSITGNGADVLYTPLSDFFGVESFTYTIDDGNGLQDTATIIVTVDNVNDDPTANDDSATVQEDSTGNVLDLLANDTIAPDEGETLTITSLTGVDVQPDFATRVVNNGSNVEYTPPADFFGREIFDYEIGDGNGGSATAQVTVDVENINDAPTANDDPGLFAFEFLPTSQTLDVLANDSSLPDDPDEVLIIVSVQPISGRFDSASSIAVAADGKSLDYMPNPERAATFKDQFTYTIADPSGLQDSATGTVEVLPLTRPKARDDFYTLDEDTSNNVLDVTTSEGGRDFFNESSTERTLVVITPPANGTAVVSGMEILYTPNADFFGSDTLEYEIDDNFVDDEGNPSEPDQALVTITVNNVNDPPVARDDSTLVGEDSQLNRIDVMANDDDGPDEGETLVVVGATGGAGFQGSVSVAADGSVVLYTPAADFFGSESFTYEISDRNGGVASASVEVTVVNTNDDPTANDDQFDVNEDATSDLSVLDNDSIAPDIDETLFIDSAGFAGNAGRTEQGGTVEILRESQIRYQPPADYFGEDSFEYSIADGNGGSDSAMVSLTVSNVNDDPGANDDSELALKNFTEQTLDVLVNDTDAPDVGETLTIVAVSSPSQGGAVSINDGATLSYTPEPDFEGIETFTYTISDGNGGSDTATVTVDVVDAIPSTISGFLYIDADNDGEFDAAESFQDLNNNGLWETGEPFDDSNGNGFRNGAELRLGGIDVTLSGNTIKGDRITRTLQTGREGGFVFVDVLPSSMEPGDEGYTLHAEQASFLLDGKDTIGDQGGTEDSARDELRNIKLDIFGTPNANNNRFGERGVKSEFLNPSELYASSSPDGVIVAADDQGNQHWFAVMEGWDNVSTVSMTEIVADADHPMRVQSVKVTVGYNDGSSEEIVIDSSSSIRRHFRVMGHDGNGGYVLRIDGTLADLGLGDAGEGEGEYVDSVDALFASMGRAE